MSLITGQASATTANSVLFTMPPGSAVVTINSGTSSTVTAYIGMGATVATTSGGYILDPGHTLTFATYTRSGGCNVNAITGSASATLSWIISTNN